MKYDYKKTKEREWEKLFILVSASNSYRCFPKLFLKIKHKKQVLRSFCFFFLNLNITRRYLTYVETGVRYMLRLITNLVAAEG